MKSIEPQYLILAYAGMVIFTLMKIEEDRRKGQLESWKAWGVWVKNNLISIIISVITIPLLLYIATDPLISTYFPISIPTSVLVGFQTQGLFRSLMTVVGPKKDGQSIVDPNKPADGTNQ